MSTSISDKKENKSVVEDGSAPSNAGLSSKSTGNGSSNKKEGIEELRLLLVKPGEVSKVLPAAIRKSREKDGSFAEATLPVVEENIRQSAVRNPKVLADALFPVIGPAIRKAIAQALGAMVQSLNQTLEYSISPKGLGWRLEALRTGKSFAEIVILKTLLYRVEQVFLIHKDTGLLLQHVVADSKDVEDADMVSAMLTAIDDFVQDSFKTSPDATLDSLKVKELSVWIEHSPDMVLAAVIRGTPPLSLRQVLSETIEEVQYEFGSELKNFDGHAEVFESSRENLERCLQLQLSEEKKEKTFFSPTNIIAIGLGLLLLIGGFFYIRDYLRWSNYVARLKTETGIVVTESDHGFFSHSIDGLRDPLAIDPKTLLSEYNLDEDDVSQNWKSYYDISPESVVKRAENLLKPSEATEFSFENGILLVKGDVSVEWARDARKSALSLIGVNEFKVANESVLLKRRIESQNIFFECNTARVLESKNFDSLAKDIDKLSEITGNLVVHVLGFASKSGNDNTNAKFSRLRADKIKSELIGRSKRLKKLQNSNPEFLKAEIGKQNDNDDCKVKLNVTFD